MLLPSDQNRFRKKLIYDHVNCRSISLFSVTAVAVLCSMMTISCSKPTGFRFDGFSEGHVKGCYIFNQTLGVCFEVEQDSIKIAKTSGKVIVRYTNLGQHMFFYQIMDQGFIG